MQTLQERYDELSSHYIRLTELYANQQEIIHKLIENGCRSCEGHATVTYQLPAIEVDGRGYIPPYIHKLADLRQRHHLSLKELARRMDLTDGTLQAYESGQKRPSLNALEKWATALGAQVNIYIQPLESSKLLEDVSLIV